MRPKTLENIAASRKLKFGLRSPRAIKNVCEAFPCRAQASRFVIGTRGERIWICAGCFEKIEDEREHGVPADER
jgi:hypothetical protein